MPPLKALAALILALLLQEEPTPLKTAWGKIEWKADGALLYIEAWPADGKVAMPRLNNPIGTVYLVNDPAKAPLGFQPNLEDWTISKPKASTGGPEVVMVEVKGKPRPAGDHRHPRTIAQPSVGHRHIAGAPFVPADDDADRIALEQKAGQPDIALARHAIDLIDIMRFEAFRQQAGDSAAHRGNSSVPASPRHSAIP